MVLRACPYFGDTPFDRRDPLPHPAGGDRSTAAVSIARNIALGAIFRIGPIRFTHTLRKVKVIYHKTFGPVADVDESGVRSIVGRLQDSSPKLQDLLRGSRTTRRGIIEGRGVPGAPLCAVQDDPPLIRAVTISGPRTSPSCPPHLPRPVTQGRSLLSI